MPSSYILQQEPIQIGQVCHRGGFADVSKGEYLGCSVAIKHLKTNEGNSYRVFKVPSINSTRGRRSLLTFHPAVVSGDYQLETSVPSEHLAFVRRFHVHRLFPHPH